MKIISRIGKLLFALLVIATLSFIVYVNREKYVPFYENLLLSVGLDQPCSKPIIYYIGRFDNDFGQSKEEFEKNMLKAVSIWNNATGKELFKYSPVEAEKMSNLSNRKLAVNLIFDERQAVTEKLKTIEATIDSGKGDYASLKARYDLLKAKYDSQKRTLDSLITSYQADKLAYEKSLSRGTKKSQTELETLRIALNEKVDRINALSKELNLTISQLNSTVNSLNAINKDLNQKINTFNNVSMTNGPEFQEGEYVSDENGQRINIYQYNDYTKLIRVLTHEFGHAIGIDHIEDPKSMMYAYNLDSELKLSTADIEALRNICQKE